MKTYGSPWDAINIIEKELQRINTIVADLMVQLKAMDLRIVELENKPKAKKKPEQP